MTDTAAKPASTTGTDYIIFQRIGDDSWAEVGIGRARSASQAIRNHVTKPQDKIELVAVPARSWRPVTVTVETKTTIRLS